MSSVSGNIILRLIVVAYSTNNWKNCYPQPDAHDAQEEAKASWQELENSVQDILSIKEQERVLNQISQMKQQQREQLAINQKMDTLNKEMSEIDIKQLDEKLDQIKVNLTEISDELKSTIDQRNAITKVVGRLGIEKERVSRK